MADIPKVDHVFSVQMASYKDNDYWVYKGSIRVAGPYKKARAWRIKMILEAGVREAAVKFAVKGGGE